MGTWGVYPLDNDAAADWLDDLTDVTDPQALILDALEDVTRSGARSMEASTLALAAAEAVAACAGHPTNQFPSDRLEVVSNVGLTRELSALASDAVSQVAAHSDLADEFAERGLSAEWSSALTDLRQRLIAEPRPNKAAVDRRFEAKNPKDETIAEFSAGIAIYDAAILPLDKNIQRTTGPDFVEWRLEDLTVRLQSLSNGRHKVILRLGKATDSVTDTNKRRYFDSEAQSYGGAFRRKLGQLR